MTEARAPTAILLAAGVGRRLTGGEGPPKVLLDFDGETLLARHLRLLAAAGVLEVAITVGHRAAELQAEAERSRGALSVSYVENARYRDGSLLSLQAQAALLRAGGPVLLMDGDVLYDGRMLDRLLRAQGEAVLLVDRELEPGDEPVKACFDAAGRLTNFRKVPEHPGASHGESVGFFRLGAEMAAALADRVDARAAAGPASLEYEEALRDLMLAAPERWTAADVTDLPWTEIDFPEDVAKARAHVWPKLVS